MMGKATSDHTAELCYMLCGPSQKYTSKGDDRGESLDQARVAIEGREECANARALRTAQGRTPRRERRATRRGAAAPRRTTGTAQSNSRQARSLASLAAETGSAARTVTRGRGAAEQLTEARSAKPQPFSAPHRAQLPHAHLLETVPAIHRVRQRE